MLIFFHSHDSKFAKAYASGIKKSEYWKTTAEDVLDLSAKVWPIAARIYRNVYQDGAAAPAVDKSKDLSWNFANQIGLGHKEGFIELIRLYNALHSRSKVSFFCKLHSHASQLTTKEATSLLTLPTWSVPPSPTLCFHTLLV
jgi:hypothetical protein